MEKYSLSDIKLKDFRAIAGQSNVEVPQTGFITSAHSTQRRNEDNEPIANSCAKIVFTVLDAIKAKILEENGISAKELKGFTVELEMPEKELLKIKPIDCVGSIISLEKSELAPLWVQRGQSGSYNGLKVILHDLEVVA